MSYSIRAVRATDHDVWQAFMHQYAEFYKTSVTSDALSIVWQWIHNNDEPFWCDVAVDENDNPVGFTQYQLMHRSLSGGKVCYLSDLYVLPTTRGSGLGKALIDHVFDFAKANNIANVRWLTQDYNYRARSLYDSYGLKSDFLLYSFNVDQ